jgi:hypothetical protein
LQPALQNLGIGRTFCGLLAQTAPNVGATFPIARVCRIAVQQNERRALERRLLSQTKPTDEIAPRDCALPIEGPQGYAGAKRLAAMPFSGNRLTS